VLFRSMIAVIFACGSVASADSINPINAPAGKASSAPRTEVERTWGLGPPSDRGTEEGQLSNDHSTAVTFADIGRQAEREDMQDPGDFQGRQPRHLDVVFPEPSTFLLLGAALLYCSRRLRLHLSRG
jgi:hypothetical protein